MGQLEGIELMDDNDNMVARYIQPKIEISHIQVQPQLYQNDALSQGNYERQVKKRKN